MTPERVHQRDLLLEGFSLEDFIFEFKDDWRSLSNHSLNQIASFLGALREPWIKHPERDFLNELLDFLQQKSWGERLHQTDRSKATIVFLPDQDRFSCHSCFQDLRDGSRIVQSSRREFDSQESVVEGLTLEVLGWHSRKPKVAYIVGSIEGRTDLDNFSQVSHRLRELGAEEITFICPYLAWTRQDRPDEERGQPATIAPRIRDITSNIDRMIVMDPHSMETARLACLRHEIAFCSFSSWRYLADYLMKLGYSSEDSIFVGPDLGRKSHAAKAAEYLNVDLVSLDKERTDGQVKFQPLTEEQKQALKGKKVIIFDDIIASATTVGKIKDLIGEDVSSITIIASHASFIKDAIRILSDPLFERIIITDSRRQHQDPPQDNRFGIISCIPLINEFLRRDMAGGFDPWRDEYFETTICKS